MPPVGMEPAPPVGSSLAAGRRARLLRVYRTLFAVLASPERAIAHYMARLARGLCMRRLVAAAPASVALSADAPLPTAFADSS